MLCSECAWEINSVHFWTMIGCVRLSTINSVCMNFDGIFSVQILFRRRRKLSRTYWYCSTRMHNFEVTFTPRTIHCKSHFSTALRYNSNKDFVIARFICLQGFTRLFNWIDNLESFVYWPFNTNLIHTVAYYLCHVPIKFRRLLITPMHNKRSEKAVEKKNNKRAASVAIQCRTSMLEYGRRLMF